MTFVVDALSSHLTFISALPWGYPENTCFWLMALSYKFRLNGTKRSHERYSSVVTPKKPSSRATKKTAAKRPRRTREEGMRLLLSATQKLLLTSTPDEIGIRDIGKSAGVHHRFVAEWFGSKVGLLRAAHDARSLVVSNLISTSKMLGERDGRTMESIRHEIVLVNWLVQHGSEFSDINAAYPALTAVKNFLIRTQKMSEASAEKSSLIFGAIAISDAMLAPHIKMKYTASDLIAHHMGTMNLKSPTKKAS